MSPKKSAVKKPEAPEPEELQPQSQETPVEAQPESVEQESPTKLETPVTPVPTLTLKYLHLELESLKQVINEHATLITQLQETLARKRKHVASNGKVQILDKSTGAVFPSKNNAYQTLLKSGELKPLVDKGVFGAEPVKNTFGWYALVRELPDRFEEVHANKEEVQQ